MKKFSIVLNPFILILMTIFLLVGCQSDNHLFGITLKEYNFPMDFQIDSTMLQFGEEISNGQLRVSENINELYTFDPQNVDSIDWDVQYTNSPNTFQLYLHALNPVAYLTKAYELCGNTEYLELAWAFVESWNEYESTSTSKENPFTWYDHGSALRAENLIYFALVAEQANMVDTTKSDLIKEILFDHGVFLADEANYTPNHNHGIFQDRALIYISFFLDNEHSEEWLSIAKERLTSQQEFAFNVENVHIENSPGYQIGVMNIFVTISDFLIQFDDEFGNKLCEDMIESAEFLTWTIKPNGAIAHIGDSGDMKKVYDINTYEEYGNPHLTYVKTLGAEGEKPTDYSAIYPKTGYLFTRNNWEQDATWSMFKSGYSTSTHKHADDLSFMLYAQGHDIFVDSGWYNYVTGDKWRDYFISSRAHNTIIVDEKTYSTTSENSSKVGLIDWELNEEYDYALGYNDMYDSGNVQIDRHYYSMNNAIILFDDIVADRTHDYSQLFHLGENMKIISYDERDLLLQIADTEYFVRIQQFSEHAPTLEIIYGNDTTEYGHLSKAMNTLTENITLKYNSTAQNAEYITLITIEDKSGNVVLKDGILNINDISYNNHEFNLSNTIINLQSRERFNADDVELTANQNSLLAKNTCTLENMAYAWYLIDINNAQIIHKQDYSYDSTFEYNVPEGEFLLKAYVKSPSGQRKSEIVSHLICKDNILQIIDNNDENWNLQYIGNSMTQLSENTYHFQVDLEYSWNYQIKWYVYKNGGYYTVFSTNENYMDFSFKEPGNYTIMYYLTTPNGDNEFWNYPTITIK